MFKVMNWKIFLATASNVWIGMAAGFLLASIFRKPIQDVIAIAIETGVQNTGVSIVVLGLSLPQPDADLASAVPVAASLMTPIPLTVAYLMLKIRRCYKKNKCMNVNDPYEKEQFKVANSSSSCESNITVIDVNTENEFDSGSSTRTSHSNLIVT